jgi:penicillin-binding protein 2
VLLPEAISSSCDIFFYEAGWRTTAEQLAVEAHRFHLNEPTGIQLPFEPDRAVIPNNDWKERKIGMKWFPGDTANMSIGQGFILENPLNMACFMASVARGETYTRPTLLHVPDAPTQRSEPIGLTAAQRAALIEGMEGCTTTGTARLLTQINALSDPGVRIAGKTGTAHIPGTKNAAWFICFAPIEHPLLAIAVMIDGAVAGEECGGGRHAVPVASAILRGYFDKKARTAAQGFVAR